MQWWKRGTGGNWHMLGKKPSILSFKNKKSETDNMSFILVQTGFPWPTSQDFARNASCTKNAATSNKPQWQKNYCSCSSWESFKENQISMSKGTWKGWDRVVRRDAWWGEMEALSEVQGVRGPAVHPGGLHIWGSAKNGLSLGTSWKRTVPPPPAHCQNSYGGQQSLYSINTPGEGFKSGVKSCINR